MISDLIPLLDLPQQVCAQAWLSTSRSLTQLLKQLAAPMPVQHQLSELGWLQVTEQEQTVWSQLTLGQRLWRRAIEFSVQQQPWLRARVLIPKTSLSGAAGIALQYCGARSLGSVLFQDPQLLRQSVFCAAQGDWLTRHSLCYFYGKPLLITESFSPMVWQRELP